MTPSGAPSRQRKNPKTSTLKTIPVVQPPAHLPRELIDLIISTYISLFNHDPAYQWMHLRHITRYHQRHVERDFLNFWVPNLKLMLFSSGEVSLEFRARSARKKSGIVRFKAHSGRLLESEDWEEFVLYTTFVARREASRGKSLIIQLGEGILNKGYAGGGILSDIMLPNLTVDAKAGDICFDWKILFTNLFREELVMRRMRDKIMDDFLPTLTMTRKEKRFAHMKAPRHRNLSILFHLRDQYQVARRLILIEQFRDHLIYKEGPFDMSSPPSTSSYYNSQFFLGFFPILDKTAEESMVFHIPGWESWNIREVAQVRAKEEMCHHDHYRCELVVGGGLYRHLDMLEERWDAMSGKKRVSEKTLEKYLKSTCPE